jgi:hypothetical protein
LQHFGKIIIINVSWLKPANRQQIDNWSILNNGLKRIIYFKPKGRAEFPVCIFDEVSKSWDQRGYNAHLSDNKWNTWNLIASNHDADSNKKVKFKKRSCHQNKLNLGIKTFQDENQTK